MTIENIINISGKEYRPYMGELVNHLPMVQWAIYKLGEDDSRVDKFTKEYLESTSIDKVKDELKTITSLKEALGKRELYEETLVFLKKEALDRDIEDMTSEILNKYKLGISSGLFHAIIRLGYAIEAYREREELKEELLRSLAYYITSYKESKLFKREIEPKEIRKEMEALAKNLHIKKLLEKNDTLGQRIKSLYNDKEYLEKAFIIKGDKEEKLKTLLEMLISLSYSNNNIVILHCITSIDAIITLESYYEDFEEIIDILTTSIITHLIPTAIDKYPESINSNTGFSWRCLKQKALKSKDVHDIKLTYSSYKLDRIFNIEALKDISLKRIRHG